MDGLYGKTQLELMILGGKPTIFGNTHVSNPLLRPTPKRFSLHFTIRTQRPTFGAHP